MTTNWRLKRWQGKSDKLLKKEARLFFKRPPVGESQSNGIIQCVVGLVAGQVRILKTALEHRIGTRIPPDACILCWLMEFAACLNEQVRHRQRRKDTAAEAGKMGTAIPSRSVVGMLNSSSAAVVVTEQGPAIKTRSANIRRIPESERWDADRILGIRAIPWSPDGSDNAFDNQVEMERPAEMVPRALGEVLMENKVEDLRSQEQTSNNGVSVKVVLDADTCELVRSDDKLTAKHAGGGLKTC